MDFAGQMDGHAYLDRDPGTDYTISSSMTTSGAALYFTHQEESIATNGPLYMLGSGEHQGYSTTPILPMSTIFEESGEACVASHRPSSTDNHHDSHTEPAAKRPRREFRCVPCGTAFTERRTLLRHQRSPAHCARLGLIAQKYCCHICRKSFTRNDLRIRHAREVHEQIRRYEPVVLSTQPEYAEQSLSISDVTNSGVNCTQNLTSDDPDTDLSDPISNSDDNMSVRSVRSQISFCSRASQNPDFDHVTSGSSSTDESRKSGWSAKIPFRSQIKSSLTGRLNPRPFPLARIKPCPICGTEFGRDGTAVKTHIDAHERQLQGSSALPCHECHVKFIHEKDLIWHRMSAVKDKTCGFQFAHTAPCTGHHPSDDVDHVAFCRFVRLWELRQLQEYRTYIDDHAAGLTPTNAPAYNAPAKRLFRMSTGSLVSTTARSYITWLSAPGTAGYKTRLSSAKSGRPSTLELDLRLSHLRSDTVFDAIDGNTLCRIKLQTAPQLMFTSDLDFKCVVDRAIQRLDFEVLAILYEAATHGKAVRAEGLYLDTARTITLTDHESLCFKETWTHTQLSEQIDFQFLQHCRRKWSYNEDTFCLDWKYVSWFCERGLKDRLRRITFRDHDLDITRGMSTFMATRSKGIDSDKLSVEIAQCFGDLGAPIYTTDWKHGAALRLAIQADIPDLVTLLIQHGKEARGHSIWLNEHLEYAVETNNADIATLILGFGGSCRRADENLIQAVAQSNHGICALLLDLGADPNAKSVTGFLHDTPLTLAADQNDENLCTLLLDRGADPNAKDSSGNTPLAIAVVQNNTHICALLLDRGADIHLHDSTGDTPLAIAVTRNYKSVCSFLLDRGANTESRDVRGNTLLMQAAARDHQDIGLLLVDRGADATASNAVRQTAAHVAARRNLPALLSRILSCNVDTAVEDWCQFTPLAYAIKWYNLHSVNVFLAHGTILDSQSRQQTRKWIQRAKDGSLYDQHDKHCKHGPLEEAFEEGREEDALKIFLQCRAFSESRIISVWFSRFRNYCIAWDEDATCYD